MNIVLVNISLDSALGGGTAERTRHLALTLARLGHRCEAIAMTGNSWKQAFDDAQIATVITGRWGRRLPVPKLNIRRAWRSIRSCDVLHIMGYWNLLSIAMGALAVLARKPYVLCPAGEFASVGKPRPIMKVFHLLLGQWLIKRASGFIAITALERDLIVEVSGRTIADVQVIPNAVNSSSGVRAPMTPVDVPTDPYILFMGRLAEVKGPDLLISAYLQTPLARQFPLVMAGPDFGMKKELVAAIARSEKPADIHFSGFLDEAERNAVYEGALLLVVPSRSEAMSLVALEAGIKGVPVLLTNTCGFDEIEQVGGGYVVEPSAEGIALGLRQMLADPEALPTMGRQLKAHIASHYTWPVIAQQLVDFCQQLARQQNR